MWILVIFCMLVMIGIWKINIALNKSTEINSDNYSNLNLPPFPELEELNEEIDSLEKLNEEDSESLEDSESEEESED